MYKSKDGKVIASLTEVKNKTGNIFTLVDEFGEVILTSYNKPRYRITKIGVADILTEKLDNNISEVTEDKSVIEKVKDKVISVTKKTQEEKIEEKVEEEFSMISKDIIAKLAKLKAWDRNNKKENVFATKCVAPIQ